MRSNKQLRTVFFTPHFRVTDTMLFWRKTCLIPVARRPNSDVAVAADFLQNDARWLASARHCRYQHLASASGSARRSFRRSHLLLVCQRRSAMILLHVSPAVRLSVCLCMLRCGARWSSRPTVSVYTPKTSFLRVWTAASYPQ